MSKEAVTMNTKRLVQGSKKLSWLLRHGAIESGVAMDEAGWVELNLVAEKIQLSVKEIEEIAKYNNKTRFQIDGERIRACQGHSTKNTPVTQDALELSWELFTGEDSIWHGTNLLALEGISEEGILPVDRTHVHLAEHKESRVGKRANVAVLLEVSLSKLRALGLKIYKSQNGVILARKIPPECLIGAIPLTKRAKKAHTTILTLLGLEG